jgi:hypothetical protein
MSGRFARSARVAITVGGVAALLVIALFVLAQSGAVNTWLTARIGAAVAPWVRFSAARVVWWPRLAVVLDNVEPARAEGAAPLGSAIADVVTCRVRLAPLIERRVDIASVVVDGLHLVVERGRDGRWYAGGLEAIAASLPAGEAASEPLPIPAVYVRNADIEYRLPSAPARLHAVEAQFAPNDSNAHVELSGKVDGGGSVLARADLEGLDDLAEARYRATIEAEELDAGSVVAMLRNLPKAPVQQLTAQGRLRVSTALSGHGTAAAEGKALVELADGTLTWSEWQTAAPLRVTTQLRWDASGLTLTEGRLDAARLTGAALVAETIEASFAYGDGAVQIESAQLRACGGTWRPAGRITLSDPPQVDATLQAEDVDAVALARTLNGFGIAGQLPQLSAPLRLSLQATGSPGGAWNGRASIDSPGAMTWTDVRADGPLHLDAEAQIAPGTTTLSNGHIQAGRVAVGPLAVDAVDGEFGYSGGEARVGALRGKAFGGSWSYSGTLPRDATAAWSGQLNGTAVDVAALQRAIAAADSAPSIAGAVDVRAQLAGRGTRALSGTVTTRLASTELTWADAHVESPAEVSVGVRLDGGRLTISNGQARAQQVHAGGVAARDLSTRFDYAGTTLRVSALHARAFSGTWQGSGAVGLDATPTWSATIEGHHVDFDALVDVLPGTEDLAGNASADLSVKITRASDGDAVGSATVALSAGSFVWDDLLVQGPARGSAAFTVRDGKVDLTQTHAEAARAAYGPVTGSAATADFQLVGQRLSFSNLKFTSCGGTWTHSGWFTLADGGPFAGQIRVQGASPPDVAAMFVQGEPEIDFARVDLDGEFSGHAVPNWLPQLHATGSVVLSDSTLPAATVLRPIWEALVGSARVMDSLARPTIVGELSDTFTLRHGRFYTNDLSLISDDYTVTALGSIGFDGSVDLRARIELTAQGVQKMLILGAIPLPTSGLPALPPIPAYVTGTLEKPVVRPNVSALPATTVRWMVDALLHAPRSLGDALMHRAGQVWNGVKRVVGAAETNE